MIFSPKTVTKPWDPMFKCVLMCMHMYKVLNFYVMRMCVNVIPKYICMLISQWGLQEK